MRATMSAAGGLLFLLGGVGLFALGIAFMVWRERRGRGLKQSVSRFRRTRRALHKIFHAHEQDRRRSRERAWRAHPSKRTGPPRRVAQAPVSRPPRDGKRRPA